MESNKTENPCPLPLYNTFLHTASQLESINKLHIISYTTLLMQTVNRIYIYVYHTKIIQALAFLQNKKICPNLPGPPRHAFNAIDRMAIEMDPPARPCLGNPPGSVGSVDRSEIGRRDNRNKNHGALDIQPRRWTAGTWSIYVANILEGSKQWDWW